MPKRRPCPDLWAQDSQPNHLRELGLSIVVGHEDPAVEHQSARNVKNVQRSGSQSRGVRAAEFRGAEEGRPPHQIHEVKATFADVVFQIAERTLAVLTAEIPRKTASEMLFTISARP